MLSYKVKAPVFLYLKTPSSALAALHGCHLSKRRVFIHSLGKAEQNSVFNVRDEVGLRLPMEEALLQLVISVVL